MKLINTIRLYLLSISIFIINWFKNNYIVGIKVLLFLSCCHFEYSIRHEECRGEGEISDWTGPPSFTKPSCDSTSLVAESILVCEEGVCVEMGS